MDEKSTWSPHGKYALLLVGIVGNFVRMGPKVRLDGTCGRPHGTPP